jgi:hypothetical protein
MPQQDGRLIYGPEEQYSLQRLPLRDGDPLDILVGKQWVVCTMKPRMGGGSAMQVSCRSALSWTQSMLSSGTDSPRAG